MKERFSLHPIGMGVVSLLMMFVILAIIAFGVLSYSTAKKDRDMAERAVTSIHEFYLAQNEGEEILADAIGGYEQGNMAMLSDLGVTEKKTGSGVVFSYTIAVSSGKTLVYEVLYTENKEVVRNIEVITE